MSVSVENESANDESCKEKRIDHPKGAFQSGPRRAIRSMSGDVGLLRESKEEQSKSSQSCHLCELCSHTVHSASSTCVANIRISSAKSV